MSLKLFAPLALLLGTIGGGASSGARMDCCTANADCCNPPQACCASAKAKADDCCAGGEECCAPPHVCCHGR